VKRWTPLALTGGTISSWASFSMLSPDDGTILFYTIKAPEKHNISYEEGVPDARQVLHHRLADSSISSQSFDLVSGTSDSNADLYAVSPNHLVS